MGIPWRIPAHQTASMSRTTDLHIVENVPLPTPAQLLSEIDPGDEAAAFVSASRKQIEQILFGDDERLLVIVGPCSIHDPQQGLDYARRLVGLAEELRDSLYIVMRAYFEKPRTTVGWKGLIMDPRLDGTADIQSGLKISRGFLRDLVSMGLPTATELLDPITPQYIADLISWSAIGARTSESQTHRQMASGLSMPLGFKNATPGSLVPAINGIKAAQQPQTFLGVNLDGQASAVTTEGNPSCHMILRGGENGPNYRAEEIQQVQKLLRKHALPERVVVDCSHANCGKSHKKMAAVFRDVVGQRRDGNKAIIGCMLESNIGAGNQSLGDTLDALEYGVSITDECIDWPTTEKLLRWASEELAG